SGDAIPIEERGAREVTHIAGWTEAGERGGGGVTPEGSPAANPAFDVTPARLVTGLITERGICPASRKGLSGLFPERDADLSVAPRPNIGSIARSSHERHRIRCRRRIVCTVSLKEDERRS